jgi:hypothetical protein
MTIQPAEDEVISYFDKLSNWGRWGPDDRLGTFLIVSPSLLRDASFRAGQARGPGRSRLAGGYGDAE